MEDEQNEQGGLGTFGIVSRNSQYINNEVSMKIVRCSWFPPKGYKAITLFKWIVVRGNAVMRQEDINHEEIHYRQCCEMLIVFFYLWYVLEFLFRLIQYRSWKQAYRNISFEREAYENMSYVGYAKVRKFWRWTYYLTHE